MSSGGASEAFGCLSCQVVGFWGPEGMCPVCLSLLGDSIDDDFTPEDFYGRLSDALGSTPEFLDNDSLDDV